MNALLNFSFCAAPKRESHTSLGQHEGVQWTLKVFWLLHSCTDVSVVKTSHIQIRCFPITFKDYIFFVSCCWMHKVEFPFFFPYPLLKYCVIRRCFPCVAVCPGTYGIQVGPPPPAHNSVLPGGFCHLCGIHTCVWLQTPLERCGRGSSARGADRSPHGEWSNLMIYQLIFHPKIKK